MELNIESDNLHLEDLENLSDGIIKLIEEVAKERREGIDSSARYISPSLLRQLYRKLVKLRELLFQMEAKSKPYSFRKRVRLRELLFQMETKSKNIYGFEKNAIQDNEILIENSCMKTHVILVLLECITGLDPNTCPFHIFQGKGAAIVQRMAIHFLLERCYWIHYNDSGMVSDLLKMLFEVDGHLGKIFDFQQLSVSSRKSKVNGANLVFETTWSEGTLSSEEILPFAYFLEQSNKAKTLFACQRLAEKYFVQSDHCRRLSNNPLILPPFSITFRFPEILIKLLEYGLFANSEPDENDIGRLLTGIIGIILNFSQNSCDRYADYTKRIIKAGNVLLRTVPHINMSVLVKYQRLTVIDKENKTRFIVQEMSVPTLLPQLKSRCTGPQDLKHLCRRTIRRALYDNWKLPHGITLLPLPIPMKDYVNLRYD